MIQQRGQSISTAATSRIDEAVLALAASWQRLKKAHADLIHFAAQPGDAGLAEMLTIELDEAKRFHEKCQADLRGARIPTT